MSRVDFILHSQNSLMKMSFTDLHGEVNQEKPENITLALKYLN